MQAHTTVGRKTCFKFTNLAFFSETQPTRKIFSHKKSHIKGCDETPI